MISWPPPVAASSDRPPSPRSPAPRRLPPRHPRQLLRGPPRRAGRRPSLRGRGAAHRRLRGAGRASGRPSARRRCGRRAGRRPADRPAGAGGLVAQRHAVRVVGITGSTGKTIAKEIVADVLARTLRTLRNEGNLNSETGLPMTLLRLEPEHEVAVLEMSMYTEGEIARLAEIARPEVGVVLAVHPAHLERAGSIEAIARAKAELPQALPRDGLAVLNADDPRVAAMARDRRRGAHLRPWRRRRRARRGRRLAWPGRHRVHAARAVGRPTHARARRRAATSSRTRWRRRRWRSASGCRSTRSRPRWRPAATPHRMASSRRPPARRWSTTPTTPRRSRWRPRSTSWPRRRWRPAGAGWPCWATCSSSGRTRSGCIARSVHARPGRPTRCWRSASAAAGSPRPPAPPAPGRC